MNESSKKTPPEICEYAGTVLTARLDRMLSHAEAVCLGEEIEAVHQMRVWSRRTRAALDVFAACFPDKEYRRLQREVKAVTSVLGAARDLDVMIGTLQKRAAALPEAQRAGVEAFIAKLVARREAGQQDVARAMAHLIRSDLPRHLNEMLHTQGIVARPAADDAGER